MADAALPAIDLQRADHEGSDGLFAWRRAAQMGLQPRQQRSRANRLRQVVVGAGFEPQHLVDFFAASGQHDNNAGVRVPHRPADRESVQSRQVDVQQNRVGTLGQDPSRGRVAAALDHGVASMLHEELRHHRRQRCVVFDEENSMARRFLVHRFAAKCITYNSNRCASHVILAVLDTRVQQARAVGLYLFVSESAWALDAGWCYSRIVDYASLDWFQGHCDCNRAKHRIQAVRTR